MLTALHAAHNVAGGSHDVWDVNLEAGYHVSWSGAFLGLLEGGWLASRTGS